MRTTSKFACYDLILPTRKTRKESCACFIVVFFRCRYVLHSKLARASRCVLRPGVDRAGEYNARHIVLVEQAMLVLCEQVTLALEVLHTWQCFDDILLVF